MNDIIEENSVGDFPLPLLRDDLELISGPVALDGSPSWLIFDPLRNKYFFIGWAAFQLLLRWSVGKASLLLNKIKKETVLDIKITDIQNLIFFLYSNSLTLTSASGSSNDYYEQHKASKPNFLMWLVHNYLFIKIPLVKPTKFLRKTLVYVEPIFSKTTAALIFFLGIIGLYIVGRQWDSFVSTFLYFFNLQGVVFYFISLVFVKILHELGHAYTSVRYGCKVPTMGIVFLVMFPMLYTDTSDTWRVKSTLERVHIGAAGMLMELYIACIATFCWGFLPEGNLKSAAFILATTSWIMSILINTNVLMRFDGYYIFSDLLGIQNLQKRSFDIGKWRLTTLLFGPILPPPETLPKNMLRTLYIYAWSIWIYRFFLFIGIALLVYHFFFKLLGVILFVIEIAWFIVLPVIKLLKDWWKMKNIIVNSFRFYITVLIVLLIFFICIYPWNTSVIVPALLKSQQRETIYAPEPAYIETSYLKKGEQIEKNQILLVLTSPEIDNQISITKKEIAILNLQIQRVAASSDDLANIQILISQLQESRAKLNGLQERKNQLIIRSSIAGVVHELEESLHRNRWINRTLPIATIVEQNQAVIEGVLPEAYLGRISLQANAKFIPDNPKLDSIWGFLYEIEQSNLRIMDMPELSSIYGGSVPTKLNNNDVLVPEKSVYRIRCKVSPVETVQVEQVVRGVLHIEGAAESFLERFYKIVISVFLRETGF